MFLASDTDTVGLLQSRSADCGFIATIKLPSSFYQHPYFMDCNTSDVTLSFFKVKGEILHLYILW